ncbi:hypothetical protein A5819_000006 [Enterococcus sp. 7E2_DIV0204]|uniref:hypothetical protein n=1 Tax=unclassified Enterococcus TaxID=2608891 RepID=UPI000A34AE40|nr:MULTISPECIES: hypothetical protein [unclassified Enterococcus]OTN87560.1 hypothetical protein A5819_000006 [Enterococcus sp. 7E2_DIV0204]OTP49754.1 hypothetical protein A5884_002954 [Enterococcus sp. 7D2_DIV0200]
MDVVERFYQEMKQTYPGINRSDCEEAIQIALVKTTNSLWKIVKQQRNEIKCRDVKRMEEVLNQILTEQKEQTKLLQTIASSMEQITNVEIAIDAKKLSQILSSSIGKTCSKTS